MVNKISLNQVVERENNDPRLPRAENGNVWIDDLNPTELVNCAGCSGARLVGSTGAVIMRLDSLRAYCPECWVTVKPSVEWIGVVCAFVYKPQFVHDLFGRPFDRLHPVDEGVLLFANHMKERQQSLF